MTVSVPEKILSIVVSKIESEGSDAVQLADVAKRARISLSTIYKHFGSRDDLIIAAVAAWMNTNVYQPLTETVTDEPLFDAMMRYFHHIFRPWEEHPRMADAFMRARLSPGGELLQMQGDAAAEPAMTQMLKDVDREFAEDLLLIVGNVTYALLFRFATHDLSVAEIMSTLERTLRRLTSAGDHGTSQETPSES